MERSRLSSSDSTADADLRSDDQVAVHFADSEEIAVVPQDSVSCRCGAQTDCACIVAKLNV